jgi:hypothetical protein
VGDVVSDVVWLNDALILDQIAGQYEKLLLLVLKKYHPHGVRITLQDIAALLMENSQSSDPFVLFTHGHKESIEFKCLRASRAKEIAAAVEATTKQGKPS